MSHEDIIRAWKDEEYRNSLSEEQRAQLPQNPAGMLELTNEVMQTIAGGAAQLEQKPTHKVLSWGCCPLGTKTKPRPRPRPRREDEEVDML